MSLILTLLSSHLLTIIEGELVNAEPAIVNMIIQEIELLISKLENYIEGKSPTVAAAATPVLNSVANTASNMVQAAGEAAVASV